MNAATTRINTPARVVALALIAVLVLGLANLRFAPDSGTVSVPDGTETPGRRAMLRIMAAEL